MAVVNNTELSSHFLSGEDFLATEASDKVHSAFSLSWEKKNPGSTSWKAW